LTGWVRNTENGSVEAVLEGEPDRVERVLAWMRTGPSRAVVANVEVHPEPPVGETTIAVR
jgi:acylphosphatase